MQSRLHLSPVVPVLAGRPTEGHLHVVIELVDRVEPGNAVADLGLRKEVLKSTGLNRTEERKQGALVLS